MIRFTSTRIAVVGAVVALAAAGVAIGAAAGGGGEDAPVPDGAKAAALAAVGGGTVTEAEGADDGQTGYEVEVLRRDGTQVEVHLDRDLNVVGTASDDD
jgi:hypothetical protein